MPTYSSHEILLDSTREEESGVEDDYSEAGTQHSRIFHSQSYFNFRVRHVMTLAEWNAYKATYNAGKRDVYTLTWFDESPQQTYSVKYTGAPQIVANIGLNRFIVEAPLRGTAD